MGDPVTMAVAGAVVGSEIFSAQKQQKLQKQALEEQRQTQADATARAAKAQRDQEQAYNAANQKKPDIGTLLTSEQAAASKGQGETLLTGPVGVDSGALKLSKSSLLGA
jgi:hypothetical protein